MFSQLGKKGMSHRLVLGRRLGGAMCRPAHHTELSTAGALCELDWSDMACGTASASDGQEIRFAGADLTDAFYQLG